MKKNYSVITLFMCIISSYAQPVLNASDFTSYYSSDRYMNNMPIDISGLSPGNSGANQTWDFSVLPTLVFRGISNVVPMASTPDTGTFPTGNFAIKDTYDGFSGSYYRYFKMSSTTFESLGGSDGAGNTYSEINPAIMFQFPYTYNTVINDTYQYSGDVEIYSFTSTYDGYGTLITPYNTFTNVFRQKYQETGVDYSYEEYRWFSTSPFRLIMIMYFDIDLSDSESGVILYTNFNTLRINSFNKEAFVKVYPNPTTSILNVELPNAVAINKIVISDISGKIIMKQNKNSSHVNVENLANGLYVLEVYSGKDKFQAKFIKQ
ncbi:T9SS type A sorting domain-containing protein [Mariniflexile sp.]|uniref:T9SS type A sorting domain-containing protein n=1 Tax=Mariniflexile sp. TaxID=1979402 RepID=UPI00356891D8